MSPIRLALIGAGVRGQYSYAPYVLGREHEAIFTAVAEPNPERRARFARLYHVPEENCFADYHDLLAKEKLADAAMVCTTDRDHVEPAMLALDKGYDLMLEKPIATTPEECLMLLAKAEETGRLVIVCHVLRYTPFFRQIKRIVDEGQIGRVVSICHNENVAFWHYSHSYVRGNWRNTEVAAPMILAKCCHDMDLLAWFTGARCQAASSEGGLLYFRPENAPKGAPRRCLDGCPVAETCPYYAPKVYLWDDYHWSTAQEALGGDTEAERLQRLTDSPYGRCVYHCDNNVVDHQTAAFLFEGGVTAAFSMCAFTDRCDRTIKIMGTEGELRANMSLSEVEVIPFATRIHQVHTLPDNEEEGHFGGDTGIMRDFLRILRGEKENDNPFALSVHAHMMAFAAERSRLESRRVTLDELERGS